MNIFYFFTYLLIGAISANCADLVQFNISTMDNPAPGYILTGPINQNLVSIYDNSGLAVYTKDLSYLGQRFLSLRVLEDGTIACFGSNKRQWVIMDKSLNVIDSICSNDSLLLDFHTLHLSPQGNYLVAFDRIINMDLSALVPNGNKNAEVNDQEIFEFERTSKAVLFHWKTSEHIDISEATLDISFNLPNVDPFHLNNAIYDADGNLLLNYRHLDEIVKVNRATGAIIWKMGGSKSKANQFTFYNDTYNNFTGFSHQHCSYRLANGNLLIFDNGQLKPTKFSRAVEYQVDEANKTVTKVWEYRHSPDIYAGSMGSATRLVNGNTIIGWGQNSTDLVAATEVNTNSSIVFEMTAPTSSYFYQMLRSVFIMDAVSKNISSSGNYLFNDEKCTTGANLYIESSSGSGNISVEKHYYLPHNINYTNTIACTILPYRWVINQSGIQINKGKLSIDLSTIKNTINPTELKVFRRQSEINGSFQLIETSFNQQFNRLEAPIANGGEFFIATVSLPQTTLLSPENNAKDILTSIRLSWNQSTVAGFYRLQVSTSDKFDKLIIDTNGINTNQLVIGALANYTRYFWRVQFNNDNCTGNWSTVNSFTTIIAVPNQVYPPNLAIDIPLNPLYKWLTVKGADKFHIQIATDSNFIKIMDDAYSIDTIYYSYKNLKLVTKYYWRVAASKAGQYGVWSDIDAFTTQQFKVNLRQPVNKIAGVPPSGDLVWDTIPGISNYELKIYKDSSLKQVLNEVNIQNKNNYKYNNFNYSSRYFWQVRGKSSDTVTLWSEVWQYRVIADTPVLKLPLDNSQNITNSGTLQWDSINNGVTYRIQLSKDSNFKSFIFDKIINNLNYNYSNLLYNSTYYWRVHAFDGETIGDWSEVRCFSTAPQLIYPANEDYKVPTKISFSWHPIVFAIGYFIQIAEDAQLTMNSRTFFQSSTDTNFAITDLGLNHTYYWTIKPKFGSSFPTYWLNPFKFTTILDKPDPLVPFDMDTLYSKTFEMRWQKSEQADKYWLQVATDAGFKDLVINNNNISDNIFNIDNIKDNSYYWRVCALSGKNGSEWTSSQFFVLTSNNLPLISPNGGEVWGKDSNGRIINWPAELGDKVRIDLLKSGMYYSTISSDYKSANQKYLWQIPDSINGGTSYQVRVTSLTNNKIRSISQAYFTIDNTSEVKNYEDKYFDVTCYPNPFETNTTFEISLKTASKATVSIYDENGRLVTKIFDSYLSGGIFRFKYNAELLPAGFYIYEINVEGITKTGRMTLLK
ncbi:MAG: aryl-sulfate sulfotransferase [Candidatus Kapabacteria bacterium]|nr:aryl-sulfate sulfotransferase [Candidatus Kapabacteria bacterium]